MRAKKYVARLVHAIRVDPILPAILLGAFLVRVAGIGYGLPLMVVNDETPFTFAALQMIQSQTVIPALHPELFRTILPYPPYLSYILLAPFLVILGVQYLLFQGSAALFQATLVSDLSALLLTARFINVLIGVASVYLVYRIAKRWFNAKVAALAAAFLLATSMLHIALSMVGRNWMPTAFVLLLVLYVLTRDLPMRKRYLASFVIAGIGMGISSLSGLAIAFMALYYCVFELSSFARVRSDLPIFVGGSALFTLLSFIPLLLHQSGNAFLGAVTIFEPKTFLAFIASPLHALALTAFSEPVLTLLFLVGLFFLARYVPRIALFIGGWFLLYVAVFYLLFRFDPRFMLPLVPLCALAGGYAVDRLWNRRTAAILCILLALPLIAALRLDFLALRNDTRLHAREWVLTHVEPRESVLVYSSALHIPTQAAAVAELRAIDPRALRKVDEADALINRHDVPHVLNNLTSLMGSSFMDNLPTYARAHEYTYLVLEPRSLAASATTTEIIASLTQNATVVARFDGFGSSMSLWESSFLEPFSVLFADKMLGPDMVIYLLD